jgi:hypothetical protein
MIVGLVVVILLCLALYGQTVYALADRKLEMVFVVADAETGQPVPGARVELLDWTRDPEHDVCTSVTRTDGTATFYREKNSCEDVIRPFRKTVTLIDLTWASVNVSAKGYQPVEQMWLHGSKYEDHGSSRQGNVQRITFNIPLRR